MTSKAQARKSQPGKTEPAKAQSVQVVEADIFDRMNETRELIVQRAYEIYESRGGGHGSDQDDWFTAEDEIVPKLAIEYQVTDGAVQVTTQVPGFDAKDLEVEIGHQRAVICAVHLDSIQAASGFGDRKRVMRVVDLPFDVDPVSAKATLKGGMLQVVLPRLR